MLPPSTLIWAPLSACQVSTIIQEEREERALRKAEMEANKVGGRPGPVPPLDPAACLSLLGPPEARGQAGHAAQQQAALGLLLGLLLPTGRSGLNRLCTCPADGLV